MEDVQSPGFTLMGPRETSVNPQILRFNQRLKFFCSGRWKKRLMVREIFYISTWVTYRVSQLYNRRRHPRHAEHWTGVLSILLL